MIYLANFLVGPGHGALQSGANQINLIGTTQDLLFHIVGNHGAGDLLQQGGMLTITDFIETALHATKTNMRQIAYPFEIRHRNATGIYIGIGQHNHTAFL